jgi:hypothetical protein
VNNPPGISGAEKRDAAAAFAPHARLRLLKDSGSFQSFINFNSYDFSVNQSSTFMNIPVFLHFERAIHQFAESRTWS